MCKRLIINYCCFFEQLVFDFTYLRAPCFSILDPSVLKLERLGIRDVRIKFRGSSQDGQLMVHLISIAYISTHLSVPFVAVLLNALTYPVDPAKLLFSCKTMKDTVNKSSVTNY